MNMREKIARAIFETFRDRSDVDASWEELNRAADAGARVSVRWRQDAYAEADAALDALMDATPEMIRALKPDMDYEEVYTAMIRAAKEGK